MCADCQTDNVSLTTDGIILIAHTISGPTARPTGHCCIVRCCGRGASLRLRSVLHARLERVQLAVQPLVQLLVQARVQPGRRCAVRSIGKQKSEKFDRRLMSDVSFRRNFIGRVFEVIDDWRLFTIHSESIPGVG